MAVAVENVPVGYRRLLLAACHNYPHWAGGDPSKTVSGRNPIPPQSGEHTDSSGSPELVRGRLTAAQADGLPSTRSPSTVISAMCRKLPRGLIRSVMAHNNRFEFAPLRETRPRFHSAARAGRSRGRAAFMGAPPQHLSRTKTTLSIARSRLAYSWNVLLRTRCSRILQCASG